MFYGFCLFLEDTAMNESKKSNLRFWQKWKNSGAVGRKKVSTLVSEDILIRNVEREGVDVSKICSIKPRWAESAPRSRDAKSALVRCDLIIRSDGSAVALDGCMGCDSMIILELHITNGNNNSVRAAIRSYFPEVEHHALSAPELRKEALRLLGWDEYAKRLTDLPK